MRVLVNCSNNILGGGVAVAASFVQQAIVSKSSGHDWRFCVSPSVLRNLESMGLREQPGILNLPTSPARIRRGLPTRRALRQFEAEFCPDVVFTVFGPPFVRFQRPHLCGFADGWATHPNLEAWSKLTLIQRVYALLRRYWSFHHMGPVDYYWTETEVSKDGLASGLRIFPDRIRVIPNTYAPVFERQVPQPPPVGKARFLLTLSAFYIHKNLSIIPEVAAILQELDPDHVYRFTLTIPREHPGWAGIQKRAHDLRVDDNVVTIGEVPLSACPSLYNRHHYVFAPTLLETFSAVYPEAMKLERPIITTDLDFAHEICGDAALYYSPFDARQAAQQIIRLTRDPQLRSDLVRKGKMRLGDLPSPGEKFRLLVEYLEWVARTGKPARRSR